MCSSQVLTSKSNPKELTGYSNPEQNFDNDEDLPLYFDELFMSKFLEDFLDESIGQLADIFSGEVDEARRVFKDALMIMETDRVIFKLINIHSAKLLLEDKLRMVNLFYDFVPTANIDTEAVYLLTFIKELLRYQLLSFLKRL